MRPCSQSIFWDKARGAALWRIGVLEEVTGLAIAEALHRVQGLFLRQKGYAVGLGNVRLLEERSYEGSEGLKVYLGQDLETAVGRIARRSFLQEIAPACRIGKGFGDIG